MTQAVATGIWTGPIGFVPVSAWAGSPGAVFEIKTGPTDYAILTEVLIYVGALGSGPTAQLTLGFGKSASAGTLVNPTAVSSLDGSRTYGDILALGQLISVGSSGIFLMG
jgi:hypothetical protein